MKILGVSLIVFFAVGAIRGDAAGLSHRGMRHSLIALFVGVLLFNFAIPVGFDARHLIYLVPVFIIMSVFGLSVTKYWLQKKYGLSNTMLNCLALVLLFIFFMETMHYQNRVKRCRGFADAATLIVNVRMTCEC